MKNIPIKFRGKNMNGHYVYGHYLTCTHGAENEDKVLWIGDEVNGYHIVAEDSLAQLVGYDSNGNEVYEDDIVDAFFDDTQIPSYSFNAGLFNNFPVSENFKLVRRNEE